MSKLYISYGSNTNLEQMSKRCPDAVRVGTGVVKGYRLIIPGVASIVPDQGKMVPVVLWEITDLCERMLDIYEGYPELYRKEMIKVTNSEGMDMYGMAYILNEPFCNCHRIPTKQYINTILKGYEENNIDATDITF